MGLIATSVPVACPMVYKRLPGQRVQLPRELALPPGGANVGIYRGQDRLIGRAAGMVRSGTDAANLLIPVRYRRVYCGTPPHAARLPAHIDLTSEEAGRVLGFRRLVALGWFLQLGPSGPATPHNPPGTLRRMADRVLELLG